MKSMNFSVQNKDIKLDDDWKIIQRQWQIHEIIYKTHILSGLHLKIEPTIKIEKIGYR